MREDYDPAADGIRSYYAALEAKRARGDTHYVKPPVDYEIDAEPPIEVPGPMSWECKCFLIAVGIVIAMLVLWAGRADAHQAPTGWTFDPVCCGNGDCKPVPMSTIKETPKGYLIEPTGEVIPYQSTKVRPSPDGMPYRCSAGGSEQGVTYCIYVNKGGV